MNFGLNFNKLLRENKLTKTEVASRLGIARNTLDDYISGRTSITLEKILKLSDILGVEYYELLGKSDNAKGLQVYEETNVVKEPGPKYGKCEECEALKRENELLRKTVDTQEKIIRLMESNSARKKKAS